MATLYKPKVTSYLLPGGQYHTPDGKRVTAQTPGAVKVESESSTWWGRYTDGAGKEHQVRLSKSEEAARRRLDKLESSSRRLSKASEDRPAPKPEPKREAEPVKNNRPAAAPLPEKSPKLQLLSAKDLARLLNVKPSTVMAWERDGVHGIRMACVWVGARRRFTLADYEAWQQAVDERKNQPRELIRTTKKRVNDSLKRLRSYGMKV